METLLYTIIKGQEQLMSKVTDFAAKEEADITALDAKLTDIGAGVTELKALIIAFQNTVTGLTPEEQAALDAVVTASDALVVKANAIDTTAPAGGEPPVV